MKTGHCFRKVDHAQPVSADENFTAVAATVAQTRKLALHSKTDVLLTQPTSSELLTTINHQEQSGYCIYHLGRT
jgi:hypothetical protein